MDANAVPRRALDSAFFAGSCPAQICTLLAAQLECSTCGKLFLVPLLLERWVSNVPRNLNLESQDKKLQAVKSRTGRTL